MTPVPVPQYTESGTYGTFTSIPFFSQLTDPVTLSGEDAVRVYVERSHARRSPILSLLLDGPPGSDGPVSELHFSDVE